MYILIANSFNSFKLLWSIAYDIVLSSVTILIWKQHFLVQILSFFLSFAGIFNLKVKFYSWCWFLFSHMFFSVCAHYYLPHLRTSLWGNFPLFFRNISKISFPDSLVVVNSQHFSRWFMFLHVLFNLGVRVLCFIRTLQGLCWRGVLPENSVSFFPHSSTVSSPNHC